MDVLSGRRGHVGPVHAGAAPSSFSAVPSKVDWHFMAVMELFHCRFSAVSVQFQKSWLTLHCSELFGALPTDSVQFQCSFSAVPKQLTDWLDWLLRVVWGLLQQIQCSYSAVSVQFRCSFSAVLEQFQKHSKKLCYSFRAISDQFHMFNRAMPGQFLNSFRAVSEQFQVTSNAVQQTKKKGTSEQL